MVFDILKNAEKTWREIASLVTPLDSDKPVIMKAETKHEDLEAYTDDKRIYVNIDPVKLKKNFEGIIVPVYKDEGKRVYSIRRDIDDGDLLSNLIFDNFLFVLFHEQLHPWLCPNSKEDERKITKTLYDGIKEAEPTITKAEAFAKVNNSKNLIWDVVLNVSFLSKTGNVNDNLENKIEFVFEKDDRKIKLERILRYPNGVLPIVYAISANNRTTDIPISLVGGMYSTLSFNSPQLRTKVMDLFLKDLESKQIANAEAKEILKKMYLGFVSDIEEGDLKKKGIDKDEYKDRTKLIGRFNDSDYESNQKYFISGLTKIFDSRMRYDSLKGFIKVLSKYLSLNEKQGSPDQNTGGSGGGGGGSGSGSGEEQGESGSGSGGAGQGDEKSQEEMDANSMGNTLGDLLGELDENEANDLLGEIANSGSCGPGAPRRSGRTINPVNIMAIDEYYKRNAEPLDVMNSREEMSSFDIGNKRIWKHVRTDTLTAADVSRLNHGKLVSFQKATGLPVLVDAGNGFYKLNQYTLKEVPQKSYSYSRSGIEVPDNWVFLQDSSSSMTGHQYVGTGNSFDLLNHVKYGLFKSLHKVCKEMKKDFKFGVVDFSDTTRYNGMDSLVRIFESRSHPVKNISLTPQCGGTCIDSRIFSKISRDLTPGKTIYTLVTDGEIYGDTTGLYTAIEHIANQQKNAFVFVEINSNSAFGQSIKDLSRRNDAVLYYSVRRIADIKSRLGRVLIKYK